MKAPEWKTTEVAILSKHYEEKGPTYCATLLDRSMPAIYIKARDMGLRYYRKLNAEEHAKLREISK